MRCPADNATLLLSERQGVEIDYCPECRGVWLDRGELDKLLERSERDDDHDRDPRSHRRDPGSHAPKKRKKGWLSEMFEVD